MCYCCRKLNLQTFSNRPQMYSCLIGSDRFCLKCTAVWLAQTENQPQMYRLTSNVHLRPICTFEADFLYIWGRFNLFSHVICLSQSDSCTFEAESVWANQTAVHLRPKNRPQMYRENRPQMYVHLRPILAKLIDRFRIDQMCHKSLISCSWRTHSRVLFRGQ